MVNGDDSSTVTVTERLCFRRLKCCVVWPNGVKIELIEDGDGDG